MAVPLNASSCLVFECMAKPLPGMEAQEYYLRIQSYSTVALLAVFDRAKNDDGRLLLSGSIHEATDELAVG